MPGVATRAGNGGLPLRLPLLGSQADCLCGRGGTSDIITPNTMSDPLPLTSISVQEALEAILGAFAPLEAVTLPLSDAVGLVLAEDVSSDIDLPPFDNSAMDGYAVQAGDVAGAVPNRPASLRVTGYVPAGAALGPEDRVEPGTAFRIMTGAPVPPGADAVV